MSMGSFIEVHVDVWIDQEYKNTASILTKNACQAASQPYGVPIGLNAFVTGIL